MRGSELPYYGALQWLQLGNPVVQKVVGSAHAPHRRAARVQAHANVAVAAAVAVAGNLRAAAAERAPAPARAVDASVLRADRAEVRRVSLARGRAAAASGPDRGRRFNA